MTPDFVADPVLGDNRWIGEALVEPHYGQADVEPEGLTMLFVDTVPAFEEDFT
jgi:hypothetical protein